MNKDHRGSCLSNLQGAHTAPFLSTLRLSIGIPSIGKESAQRSEQEKILPDSTSRYSIAQKQRVVCLLIEYREPRTVLTSDIYSVVGATFHNAIGTFDLAGSDLAAFVDMTVAD